MKVASPLDAAAIPAPCDDVQMPAPGASPSALLAFWLAYWLGIGLICVKLVYFGMPAEELPGWLGTYFWSIAVATAADNLFVVILGGLMAITFALLRRRRRGLQWAVAAWTAVCAGCLLYAIINSYIFAFAGSPLSRELIEAAGSWEQIRSSIAVYVDAATIRALSACPLVFLLVVYVCNRFIRVPRSWAVRGIIALLALGVAGQFIYARSVQAAWIRRDDYRIARNAHWMLVSSWLGRGEQRFSLPPTVPGDVVRKSDGPGRVVPADFVAPELDAEFRPARDRGGMRPHVIDALSGKPRPRNVIVFVFESTSTQFLHLYGTPYLTTPNLDAEAVHGLVLNNFYCHIGRTAQAFVAINTSNFPRGGWQFDPQEGPSRVYQPGILLSEILKRHDYRSLALTTASFSFDGQRHFIENRGYDRIIDRDNLQGATADSWGKYDRVLPEALFQWIDEDPARSRPFFALCWTNQTHDPYPWMAGENLEDLLAGRTFPEPANAQVINRYLNCVKEGDKQLGRIFAGLRQRGLADDTLVVITADHGEAFRYPHYPVGHGMQVFEEIMHIPCMLWNPRLFAGARSDAVGGQIDLAPTIVDLLGFEGAGTWQGYSLFDRARPGRVYFHSGWNDNRFGVREGDWKYVYNANTGVERLCDLRSDPLEMNEVSASFPDIHKALRQRTVAWIRYQDRHGAGVRP